jgi:hypothetical protein
LEKRLVDLLVEQGAVDCKWVGEKQISGPLEQTPLSVLIQRSSVLGGTIEGRGCVPLQHCFETEFASTSAGRQKNDKMRSDLETKLGKAFRAGLKNWRKSRFASQEED